MTTRRAKDDMPVTATAAYYVHYRSLDEQGGYWRVSPKGPYASLNKARAVAWAMIQDKHRHREVKLVLRTETEISIIGSTWPI